MFLNYSLKNGDKKVNNVMYLFLKLAVIVVVTSGNCHNVTKCHYIFLFNFKKFAFFYHTKVFGILSISKALPPAY